MLPIISLLAWNATQRNGIHYNQYQSDREFKISPHALHVLRLVVSSLQLALKLLEIGLDGGHCHGAFGMVFRKEILLSARPNLGGFAVLLLRRDDDFDRILIDAVLDNIGIRKDPLEGLQGRNVFLLPTISVPRLILLCVVVVVVSFVWYIYIANEGRFEPQRIHVCVCVSAL